MQCAMPFDGSLQELRVWLVSVWWGNPPASSAVTGQGWRLVVLCWYWLLICERIMGSRLVESGRHLKATFSEQYLLIFSHLLATLRIHQTLDMRSTRWLHRSEHAYCLFTLVEG